MSGRASDVKTVPNQTYISVHSGGPLLNKGAVKSFYIFLMHVPPFK